MEVTVLNRQRQRSIRPGGLQRFVARLARELPAGDDVALSLCLVSDARMRQLNRTFRRRDATTDVLSFPGETAPDGSCYLGDVVISVPVAARQARRRGHSLSRELKRLALHGYLHLLGYDHETDGGQMTRLERRLVRRLLPHAGEGA